MNNQYITKQGDTWDSIAHRLYGNEHAMHELIALNLHLADVLIFDAGETLHVPRTVPTHKQNANAKELPPWRQ